VKALRWAPRTRQDFLAIDRHYRPIAPGYSDHVLLVAIRSAEFLQEHPRAGAVIDEDGRRKWRVADTPYILLYREAADHIRILRVLHHATDWKPA
jgi:toxin ParE1/3/4